MYQLSFYVPESHLELVKEAVFAAGAGKIGEYCHCSWQVLGQGQYLPLQNSNPSLGDKLKLNSLNEYKVEMICAAEFISNVVLALKTSHPYEEVAYSVVKIEPF